MAKNRLHVYETAPKAIEAFVNVETMLASSSLSPLLRHLVKLRVSQINGCAFCVNMHIREAREDQEKEARLDNLVVWREVDDYSDAERAALDWAEALTTHGTGASLGDLHDALTTHFGKEEIDALTLVIVMINNWNRLQIATHNATF